MLKKDSKYRYTRQPELWVEASPFPPKPKWYFINTTFHQYNCLSVKSLFYLINFTYWPILPKALNMLKKDSKYRYTRQPEPWVEASRKTVLILVFLEIAVWFRFAIVRNHHLVVEHDSWQCWHIANSNSSLFSMLLLKVSCIVALTSDISHLTGWSWLAGGVVVDSGPDGSDDDQWTERMDRQMN